MLLDKRKEREVSIPTSSMADIAFLLLTFFLVTTSLDLDKGLGLTLPAKGQGKPVPMKNIANAWLRMINSLFQLKQTGARDIRII